MVSNVEAAKTDREDKIDKLIEILPKKNPLVVLKEMDELTGLDKVKANARTFIRRDIFNKRRKTFNLASVMGSQHTVFLGNPGTGKTTMARRRAELLHALGLAGNRYLEVTRETMVGEYIGHTEANTTEMIKAADVVFIDEAYSLVKGGDNTNDFGGLIVDALMTALENGRQNLAVFFAGYPNEMDRFLNSNPGFKSRIAYYEELPDYSMGELGLMLNTGLERNDFSIVLEAKTEAVSQLKTLKGKIGDKSFGNAREVRTIIEQVPDKMADRLFPDISEEDIAEASEFNMDEAKNKADALVKNSDLIKSESGIVVFKDKFNIEAMSEQDLKTVILEDIKALDIVNRGGKGKGLRDGNNVGYFKNF